jgi:hypothetical protein
MTVLIRALAGLILGVALWMVTIVMLLVPVKYTWEFIEFVWAVLPVPGV